MLYIATLSSTDLRACIWRILSLLMKKLKCWIALNKPFIITTQRWRKANSEHKGFCVDKCTGKFFYVYVAVLFPSVVMCRCKSINHLFILLPLPTSSSFSINHLIISQWGGGRPVTYLKASLVRLSLSLSLSLWSVEVGPVCVHGEFL